MTETASFVVERRFQHPPALVWRSLTEPALLARWWARGDVAPVVGHRFQLDMGAFGQVPCEVVVVDAPRLFSFRFGEWTMRFELVDDGGGTLLRLEQSGMDLSSPRDRFAFEHMSRGWRDEVLPRLTTLLDAP
jgi:uncharacterized protein YndB with AHSA1/START domain